MYVSRRHIDNGILHLVVPSSSDNSLTTFTMRLLLVGVVSELKAKAKAFKQCLLLVPCWSGWVANSGDKSQKWPRSAQSGNFTLVCEWILFVSQRTMSHMYGGYLNLGNKSFKMKKRKYSSKCPNCPIPVLDFLSTNGQQKREFFFKG